MIRGAPLPRSARNMEQFALFPEMLEGLPVREKTRWEQLQEMNGISRERGAMLPMATAAEVLDVSKQRVHQLVLEGRLQAFEFLGRKWVCESDMLEFARGVRTPGRPITKK